jgi:hypothetical protein
MLLGDELRVRFVVEDLERELVRLLADHDAALRIDPVDRELIGIAIDAPGLGEVSGQLHAGAERNGVGFGAGGGHVRGSQHRRGASQPWSPPRFSRLTVHHDATCFHEFSQLVVGPIVAHGAARLKRGENIGCVGLEAGLLLAGDITRSGCACWARTARPPSPPW